jgi:hypothetical protein
MIAITKISTVLYKTHFPLRNRKYEMTDLCNSLVYLVLDNTGIRITDIGNPRNQGYNMHNHV